MFTNKKPPVRKAWDGLRHAHDLMQTASVQLLHGKTYADIDEVKAVYHDTIMLLSSLVIFTQACYESLGIASKENSTALIRKLSKTENQIQDFIHSLEKAED